MASSPKQTIYGPFDNSAFVNIPVTISGVRKMVITEVPGNDGGTPPVQSAYAPQGIQYQLWDPNGDGGNGLKGAFGATQEALPGEDIPVGDGMTVIGWTVQKDQFGRSRAADIPIRVRSGTAVTTSVRVREYNRGISFQP